MPTDNKYGNVTLEKGNVPDDEPVVVFRARDETLGALLGAYHKLCVERGSPQKHLDLIEDTARKIERWQEANSDQVHTPASASYEPPSGEEIRTGAGTLIGREGDPDLPPLEVPDAEESAG